MMAITLMNTDVHSDILIMQSSLIESFNPFPLPPLLVIFGFFFFLCDPLPCRCMTIMFGINNSSMYLDD